MNREEEILAEIRQINRRLAAMESRDVRAARLRGEREDRQLLAAEKARNEEATSAYNKKVMGKYQHKPGA